MSIYTTLELAVDMEKTALDRMNRRQYAEAATPYSTRKSQYKKFIQKRSRAKKPGKYDYVPGMATVGGIAGGLMGGFVGLPAGAGGAALGAVGGGLLGAGVGALGGMSQASAEINAINNAKRVVKGGQYDKALQDEIIKYRRHKEMQARQERESKHRDITNRLDRIERRGSVRRSPTVRVVVRPSQRYRVRSRPSSTRYRVRSGGPRRY